MIFTLAFPIQGTSWRGDVVLRQGTEVGVPAESADGTTIVQLIGAPGVVLAEVVTADLRAAIDV